MRSTPLSSIVRSLAVCLGASVVACGGGGGGSATSPGSTLPVISTANTVIFIGQSVTFAATGGGTIRWGGDAPSVATVDQTTGRVTGVGNGRVTIWAENESGRTTRLLRGLPSYAGSWIGTYNIAGCEESGDFVGIGFCAIFFPGQVLEVQLQMAQTDDRVTGAFVFGAAAPGTLDPSTVAEDGSLAATGTYLSADVTVRIANTRLQSATAGVITGTFDQLWTVAGVSGSGTIKSEIRSMVRTQGGPAFGLTAPSTDKLTLEQVMRRFAQK